MRSRAVALSPTGQSWAAATTEGLLLYSLEKGATFDPTNLTEGITPQVSRFKPYAYSSCMHRVPSNHHCITSGSSSCPGRFLWEARVLPLIGCQSPGRGSCSLQTLDSTRMHVDPCVADCRRPSKP